MESNSPLLLARFTIRREEITPVAVGRALLTTEFGGATTHTCIAVTDDSTGTLARIHCDDPLRR